MDVGIVCELGVLSNTHAETPFSSLAYHNNWTDSRTAGQLGILLQSKGLFVVTFLI